MSEPPAEIVEALRRLDALTRRLRAECPWDREQDERSIVPHTVEEAFHEIGDVLFAAVNVARKLKVDPELALRAAADRFRERVQGAEGLAASEGADWNDLSPDDQIAYYARARLNEES